MEGAFEIKLSSIFSSQTIFVTSSLQSSFSSKYFVLDDPLLLCREPLRQGVANLPWIDVLPSVGTNVYSLLQRDHLIITRDALEMLEERLQRPIKPNSFTP